MRIFKKQVLKLLIMFRIKSKTSLVDFYRKKSTREINSRLFEKSATHKKKGQCSINPGHPVGTCAGVCGCSLQVCRWSATTVSPCGVVASNRAERLRANYPRLAAARLPPRRAAPRNERATLVQRSMRRTWPRFAPACRGRLRGSARRRSGLHYGRRS